MIANNEAELKRLNMSLNEVIDEEMKVWTRSAPADLYYERDMTNPRVVCHHLHWDRLLFNRRQFVIKCLSTYYLDRFLQAQGHVRRKVLSVDQTTDTVNVRNPNQFGFQREDNCPIPKCSVVKIRPKSKRQQLGQ